MRACGKTERSTSKQNLDCVHTQEMKRHINGRECIIFWSRSDFYVYLTESVTLDVITILNKKRKLVHVHLHSVFKNRVVSHKINSNAEKQVKIKTVNKKLIQTVKSMHTSNKHDTTQKQDTTLNLHNQYRNMVQHNFAPATNVKMCGLSNKSSVLQQSNIKKISAVVTIVSLLRLLMYCKSLLSSSFFFQGCALRFCYSVH